MSVTVHLYYSNSEKRHYYSANMIDVQQYRIVIGTFYFKFKKSGTVRAKGKLTCYITVIGFDVITILVIFVSLLLLSGDIEVNPGPKGKKVCPECEKLVTHRQKICSCGFILNKKGRPAGTTRAAGFNVSAGRPVGTTLSDGFNVTSGRPIGTTLNTGFNASSGRPIGTTIDAGFNASGGRPIDTTIDAGFTSSGGCPIAGRPIGSTIDAGFNASGGRPKGTTIDAGFNASGGRPIGTTTDNGALSSLIEDDPSKLTKHVEQFELPDAWNTDECSLSINESMLSRGRKYIGQQIRFDSKPLGVGMCYCCGSILWSRVDNCHTNLVDLDIDDNDIPAIAYQKVICKDECNVLQYRHRSGKLYACSVCKSFRTPSELNIDFHVGKVKTKDHLPVRKWEMACPYEILSLKNQVECGQIALCGLFSTVVKDARKHQWRHIQGEVNSLHKLDRHYYGLFGFMLMNEKVSDELTKHPDACERVRKALSWLKQNNHLYQTFLSKFETMYRYLRNDLVNPEILQLNYPEILEEEAVGMAFPIDSNYFDNFSPLYGDMDLAGIQNPKFEMVEEFKENVQILREYTSVQYGQKYLLEKTFPHLYPYGEGGWYYKCPIGFSQFNKIRLLDCRGRFTNDQNYPFFMFDYMTKLRMRAYNARRVVGVSRLECKLTAGQIRKANKDMHDPYAAYGTDVPRSIPGSRQYWKSFGLDLIAMTEQRGIPDYFLTLSPNDNWPHIQSTIRKGWGASADPSEFNDLSIESNDKMSVGPHPLESVLGAEKRFSAMLEILLNKKGGPLGIVKDYVIKTEYQKRGGLHWHILFWVEPGTVPDNVVMAEMPRHSDTSNVEAQYARRMVQKFQMHRECYPSML